MRVTNFRLALLSAPIAGLVVLVGGCSSPRPTVVFPDVASFDAGVMTDAPADGGVDAAIADAGADARMLDARPVDARPPLDAPTLDSGLDAGIVDAGPADAGASDSGATDAGPVGALIQCAPPIPPGATSGILLNANIWSGFRFEILGPTDRRVTRVGIQVTPEPGPGTIFAAFVRLADGNDTPDDPALGGADVVTVVSIAVPATGGTSVVVSMTLDQTLAPGWYGVVFGTGAFGATLVSGNIPSAGGGGCRSLGSGRFPFTIRQSDGMFILQGAEPHMFVELAPP